MKFAKQYFMGDFLPFDRIEYQNQVIRIKKINMNRTRREIVAEYCEKIRSGEIEFSKLESILKSNNHSEEDIDIIVKRVDRDLQRMAADDVEAGRGKQMFYGGLLIMLLGVGVTVASYIGIIDLGDEFIIAYGPALGGLGLALVGKLKMNR